MNEEPKDLLLEAQATDYGLRSTFFYRKLNELGFMEFAGTVDQLVEVSAVYLWDERAEWQISESAWTQVKAAKIEPVRVFAHPLICVQNPRLLAYYRNVAAISQKGAKRLSVIGSIEAYETGRKDKLPQDRALSACRLFNRHISAIIDSTVSFSRRDIDALLFASAGAQIDGAWRNAIGEEAEALVRRILVRRIVVTGLLNEGKIAAFQRRNGSVVAAEEVDELDLTANLGDYHGFTLINGTAIIFSSEPDMSLRTTDGKLTAAIEVKGGKDPAGALERFGAAQKSFLEARSENPFVHTIFIASCITEQVAKRIEEARNKSQMFHEVINLSELLASEDARATFIRRLLWLLSAE